MDNFKLSLCALALLLLAGCRGSLPKPDPSQLSEQDPALRIRAIKAAGANHATEAIPQLVAALEDEDPAVRFYAIGALKRITGTDRGYNYADGAAQRAAGVGRWRASLPKVVQAAAPKVSAQ